MADRLVAVLDIGKTMAKLTLWTRAGTLVARETRANGHIDAGGYQALDAEGIEAWLAVTLAHFATLGDLGAIVPVGHGAAAAIVRDGRLALAPLDYEQALGAGERASYDDDRGSFTETGSPALPDGLNLGAQLHFLEVHRSDLLQGDAQILLWPQYWAWRLCGVAASEVTSLGCHTDLWNPVLARPSRLAAARGWAARLPPVRPAGTVLGMVGSEWQLRCGVSDTVAVHCGLHDSNAALLAARGFAEIAGHEATVLSTGTWFVAMRSPGDGVAPDLSSLSEARDCLVNLDVEGRPTPSARFMGGREIEQLIGLDTRRIDIRPDQPALIAAVPDVIAAGARVLPTFAPGFGPFPNDQGRWVAEPAEPYARRAAVSLYAALVADVALGLVGTRERVLVEGRFAEAEVFVRGLASLRPDLAIYRANAHNDVSFGALRLLDPTLTPEATLERVQPLDIDLSLYRQLWRYDVGHREAAA